MRGLGDVDGELTPKRVDSHHAAVRGRVAEGRDLVVVPWDAVQGLGDICGPLQNDLLPHTNTLRVSGTFVKQLKWYDFTSIPENKPTT